MIILLITVTPYFCSLLFFFFWIKAYFCSLQMCYNVLKTCAILDFCATIITLLKRVPHPKLYSMVHLSSKSVKLDKKQFFLLFGPQEVDNELI